jgi:hypothetical protein
MLQIAMAYRSSSDHQRAVGHRFSYCLIYLSGRQRGCRAYCRASIPKRYIVRVHKTEMGKSEVAHGPGRRTNIEGIAHVHKDDVQTREFGGNRQAVDILRQEGITQ